jgi:hypothetical protein
MKVDSDPIDSSAFSLVIACGPFTADSDLTYTPLANLIETLQKDKPSALLLVREIFCRLFGSIYTLASGWPIHRRRTPCNQSW